jgi:hypothetical protein
MRYRTPLCVVWIVAVAVCSASPAHADDTSWDDLTPTGDWDDALVKGGFSAKLKGGERVGVNTSAAGLHVFVECNGAPDATSEIAVYITTEKWAGKEITQMCRRIRLTPSLQAVLEYWRPESKAWEPSKYGKKFVWSATPAIASSSAACCASAASRR